MWVKAKGRRLRDMTSFFAYECKRPSFPALNAFHRYFLSHNGSYAQEGFFDGKCKCCEETELSSRMLLLHLSHEI